METDELKKKAEDVINDISENETVKAIREKVEDFVSEENLKNMKEKVEGVINDISENETVKAVREKIEDTVEQLTSSETAQQAKEFVSEQTDRAGEFIKESAQSVEKSGFMQKLKSIFGLK